MANDGDIQASAILRGLNSLAEALVLEPVNKALDLDHNAKTAHHFDLLVRLRRSLSQYVNREDTLFYVGLLGHFSAGKSSTINSILDISKTADARKTSQNPTDRLITLITHTRNSQSLVGIAREGNVTVRYYGLDNPLLEHIAIADTPGQGDPGLVTEMVRDFLPLCDLMLFLFSAASPFDSADVSLLSEIHSQLNFVPLHFVVTRANEFAKNAGKPVSDSNIDKTKTRVFFDELIPRVNSLVAPKVYTQDDFTLIDNLSDYNIDVVKNMIIERCDPLKVNTRVSMRDHKIIYFRNNANAILEFFSEFVSERISALGSMVEQTNRNIDRYNEAVNISNIQLTRKWHEKFSKIESSKTDSASSIRVSNNVPINWSNLDAIQLKRREAAVSISEETRRLASSLTTRARDRATLQLRENLRHAKDRINVAEYLDSVDGTIESITINIKSDPEGRNAPDLKRFSNIWDDLRRAEFDTAAALLDSLRSKVGSLETFVRKAEPFAVAEESVVEMQSLLNEDLNRFFVQVELYLDGVISLATKQNVAALGIGGQLDELLVKLQEADKAAYVRDTMGAVFPQYDDIQVRVASSLADLGSKIRGLADLVRSVTIPSRPDNTIFKVSAPEAATKVDELSRGLDQDIQTDVDRIANKLNVQISDDLAGLRSRYQNSVKVAKSERRNRYLIAIIGFGLLATVAAVATKVWLVPAPSFFGEAFAWGVVGNLVGSAVGFFVGKTFDNFPQSKKTIREKYEAEARSRIATIFQDAQSDTVLSGLGLTGLMTRLNPFVGELVDLDGHVWSAQLQEHHAQVRGLWEQCRSISLQCIKLMDETLTEISSYFSNPEQTLEGLRDAGQEIKQKAIEPSFALLEETKLMLDNVQKTIKSVSFI